MQHFHQVVVSNIVLFIYPYKLEMIQFDWYIFSYGLETSTKYPPGN